MVRGRVPAQAGGRAVFARVFTRAACGISDGRGCRRRPGLPCARAGARRAGRCTTSRQVRRRSSFPVTYWRPRRTSGCGAPRSGSEGRSCSDRCGDHATISRYRRALLGPRPEDSHRGAWRRPWNLPGGAVSELGPGGAWLVSKFNTIHFFFRL